MALVYVVVSTIVALSIWLYRRAYPQPYAGIPHHKRSAKRIMGDVPDLLHALNTTQDPSKFIIQQCRQLGSPVIQLFLRPFSEPLICIDDVREVENILTMRTKEFIRAPMTFALFKPFVPHSSITKHSDAEWKRQRRLWVDFMSTGFLHQTLAPKMHQSALELADLFKAKSALAGGRPFCAKDDFELLAFDVIWNAVVGVSLNGVVNKYREIRQGAGTVEQPPSIDAEAVMPMVKWGEFFCAVQHLNASIEKIRVSPMPKIHLWFLLQMPTYKRYWSIKNNTINALIGDAKERFKRLSGSQVPELGEATCALDLALLRVLSTIEKAKSPDVTPMTPEELHDELFMMILAGQETTAMSFAWAAKLLTNSALEQTKLREALLTAFPNSTSKDLPSADEIIKANIPYMDASLEEVVRLANLIPRLARVATVDAMVLGYRIPKGAQVLCTGYAAEQPFDIPESVRSKISQEAKKNYRTTWDSEDMDGFHPERWLDDAGNFDSKSLPRLAFGAGPRACFGTKLALLELRITLTILLLSFRFEAIPEALNSPLGRQRVVRTPRQSFVRLVPL